MLTFFLCFFLFFGENKWRESIAGRNRTPRRKTEGRGPNQASPNPTTYQYI
jgi:hypothetical protein